MPNILILGANGQLARHTIPFFLKQSDVHLTLYLRRANRLKNPDPGRVEIGEGDVLDAETLKATMQGQDVVYANLAGAMEQQAKTIVTTMHQWRETTDLHQLDGHLWRGARREIPKHP